MLEAFLISFGVIFVAELGDKSQLMALAFATRYKPWPVLAGISIATAATHLISVAIGGVVGASLPTKQIGVAAAVAFVVFGIWTLRGDQLSEGDERRVAQSTRNVLVAVTTVFFLAELGDKTMLATVTLATREGIFGTWLGSTLGMIVADALAIVVGRAMGKRLPEKTIRVGAAVSFFIFAIVLFVDAIR